MSKAGAGEFVTMQVLKEMLAMQDRAYRSSIQILVEDIKSEVKELKKEISELKESASFTSSKYEEMKANMGKVDVDIKAIYHQIDGLNNDYNYSFEELEAKQEYLEINQSRRNNAKIVGVKESDDEKTWDDTEKVVKNLIKNKLGITEEVSCDREGHRVGRKMIKNRAHNRHVGSASPSGDDSAPHQTKRKQCQGRSWRKSNVGKRRKGSCEKHTSKDPKEYSSSTISLNAPWREEQVTFLKCWRPGNRER